MNLTAVPIEQAKAERRRKDAQRLREIADDVESGAVGDFSFVADNLRDRNFMALTTFDNRWTLLGALEWAKSKVHEAE